MHKQINNFQRKKRSILSLQKALLLATSTLMGSQIKAASLPEKVNEAFMPVAEAWEALVLYPLQFSGFSIPIVLILLVISALFFTVYFGFANIRLFPLAIRVVRGQFDDMEKRKPQEDLPDTIRDEEQEGEVNHFQALTTAVSGTVGLGNISMVAVAISIGGPGATFWMIVAGLLGMSSKFVECTLGVRYREIDEDGRVFGGPMYYLSKGLKERGFSMIGKLLAVAFAVLCVGASFGGGNAFQSNQASAQIIGRFGLDFPLAGPVIGCLFAFIVAIVILGGVKRIGKVTEKIVPFMAGFYVLAAVFILLANFSLIDDAVRQIVSEAFTPRSGIVGGVAAVIIQGFRRAAFSNEAGAGSAAIAHSAVKTKYPASEGLVGLLEPFIDTVVICTLTALVIVIFNIDAAFQYGDVINGEVLLESTQERIGGIQLTSLAFDNSIPGFSYLLAISVVLFAISTMLSWSYYGLQSWTYLFGKGRNKERIFKILFLLFIVLGSSITLDAVIKFSDAMILALVFPNMIGLLFLFPKVKEELNKYLSEIKAFES